MPGRKRRIAAAVAIEKRDRAVRKAFGEESRQFLFRRAKKRKRRDGKRFDAAGEFAIGQIGAEAVCEPMRPPKAEHPRRRIRQDGEHFSDGVVLCRHGAAGFFSFPIGRQHSARRGAAAGLSLPLCRKPFLIEAEDGAVARRNGEPIRMRQLHFHLSCASKK